MGNQPGYVGFRAHDGAEVEISNIQITPIKSLTSKSTKTSSIKLASAKMEVTFSKEYPTVYQYKIKEDGTILPGSKSGK